MTRDEMVATMKNGGLKVNHNTMGTQTIEWSENYECYTICHAEFDDLYASPLPDIGVLLDILEGDSDVWEIADD